MLFFFFLSCDAEGFAGSVSRLGLIPTSIAFHHDEITQGIKNTKRQEARERK